MTERLQLGAAAGRVLDLRIPGGNRCLPCPNHPGRMTLGVIPFNSSLNDLCLVLRDSSSLFAFPRREDEITRMKQGMVACCCSLGDGEQ
jgi:hypothetical protein